MTPNLLRNMLISALLLAGFSALGTGLVVTTFELTKEQIEISEKENLLKNLNNILTVQSYDNNLLDNKLLVEQDSLLGRQQQTTINQAWKNKQPVAVAFAIVAPDGYSGDFRLLFGIIASGKI
jgi:electron transport complex protein RnfG